MTLSKGRLSTQYHLVGYFYTIVPPIGERRTLFVLADSKFICFVISPLGPATKLSKLPNSVKIFAVVPTILQSHIGL